jgi:lipopolysaccharide/colanic/teichoic acid biosynthesis glycosyltransferase
MQQLISKKPDPGDSYLTHFESSTGIGSGIPRWFEMIIALLGLLASIPVMAIAALAIAATSRGGVLFKQTRMGKNGRIFTLFKLRTMKPSHVGPQVTSKNDTRITWIGKILRKTKLDELPELWNVLIGDISLVGPRPEVPRYVDRQNPLWNCVLQVRPGLTDPMTLRLRNEEVLLGEVEGDVELFYLTVLLPYKLKGYVNYLQQRSWRQDVKVLCETVVAILFPGKTPPPTMAEILGVAKAENNKIKP